MGNLNFSSRRFRGGVCAALFLCLTMACGGGGGGSNAGPSTPAAVSPTFITQPANQAVTEGQNASFSAQASGNPSPTYRWERSPDGTAWTAISGATQASYTFTAQAADDGSQFRVIASNSAGSATSNTATLSVSGSSAVAPSFTTQPSSQTVPAGSMVTFTAAASGSPVPTYQWERSTDGLTWVPIPDATQTSYSFITQASDNAAIFRIKASNSAGTVTSNTATLTVSLATSIPIISSFTATPNSISAGSTSYLAWAVTGATSLSISPSIGTVTGTSVAVAPAATTTYTLTAINSIGSVTATATVTVTAAPEARFTATGSMGAFRLGHAATLLPNGKVFVAGGDITTDMVELYDPSSGTFAAAGRTSSNFGNFGEAKAVLLSNDKVFVCGLVYGAGIKFEAFIYDPLTQQNISVNVSSLELTSSIPIAIAPLANGAVLLVNGQKSLSFLLDPATNSFIPGPNLGSVMGSDIVALPLLDGRVLITDGAGTELYRPSTNTFQTGPNLNLTQFGSTGQPACILQDGRVLVLGINAGCFFIPGPDTVTTISGPFPDNGLFSPNSMVLLSSGQVLVHNFWTEAFWIFDPGSQTFQATPSPVTPRRYGFTATLIPSGGLLIAGGGHSSPTNQAEIYR